MIDDHEAWFRQLLIDAICGVGFPTILLGAECVKVGLARDTSDQWNVDFEWDRLALSAVETGALQDLYEGLCAKRDKNFETDEERVENTIILPPTH